MLKKQTHIILLSTANCSILTTSPDPVHICSQYRGIVHTFNGQEGS